jgi:hypothetical protein
VAFPISRANYRTLDPDWEGQVFVADIDRTYLSTHFSSLRGMARIPFERAAEKKDIEGMARLFREVRKGPGATPRDTPLYFVSASPKQLRPVIERKMALDGIGFDGTIFKDWNRVVRRGRLRRLREQIGFKMTALLANRAHLPEGAQEILVGDDLETDPVTYGLYADCLAERIPVDDLTRVLRLNGVLASDATAITRARRELRPGHGVLRAFIRLERHADTDDFLDFAPGVLGCTGAFQMAVAMWKLGSITVPGICRVAFDLVTRGVSPAVLAERLRDLCRRAVITADDAVEIAAPLQRNRTIAALDVAVDPDPRWVEAWQREPYRVWTPARYLGE